MDSCGFRKCPEAFLRCLKLVTWFRFSFLRGFENNSCCLRIPNGRPIVNDVKGSSHQSIECEYRVLKHLFPRLVSQCLGGIRERNCYTRKSIRRGLLRICELYRKRRAKRPAAHLFAATRRGQTYAASFRVNFRRGEGAAQRACRNHTFHTFSHFSPGKV